MGRFLLNPPQTTPLLSLHTIFQETTTFSYLPIKTMIT
jgi:hypothetical protein